MICLGIESSCDDTSLALVKDGALLGQASASQEELHSIFGGVVPEIASRAHYRALGALFDKLMDQCGIKVSEIDVIAVTRGPGLLGALLTGLAFAKGLALACGARLVGVNHLAAHLLAPGLEREMVFPAVGLLVSGGHTHLYLMRSQTSLELLGRTLDDAAGEAFDKAAKMLNLPYPGGVHIDRLAALAEPDPGLFPKPYLSNQNLDFSFSGLKTAFSVYLARRPRLKFKTMPDPDKIDPDSPEIREIAGVCASFVHSVVETLRIKLERALDRNPGVRALVVAGGVAANSHLRRTMAETAKRRGLELFLPSLSLCSDNGAMAARAGEILALAGLRHDLDLEAAPRGRKVPWDYLKVPQDCPEERGEAGE